MCADLVSWCSRTAPPLLTCALRMLVVTCTLRRVRVSVLQVSSPGPGGFSPATREQRSFGASRLPIPRGGPGLRCLIFAGRTRVGVQVTDLWSSQVTEGRGALPSGPALPALIPQP